MSSHRFDDMQPNEKSPCGVGRDGEPESAGNCDKNFYVYILASKRKGALFIGVTSDLLDCVVEHKCNQVEGLTSQYAIHQLVYFERFKQAGPALLREDALKKMHRSWKLNLITQHNHDWRDLYEDLTEPRG